MSTTTLRPNGTDTNTGVSVTGAGSAHAAVNDDSDSSYLAGFTTGDTITLNLGDYSFPSGAVVKSVAVRVRCAISSALASRLNAVLSYFDGTAHIVDGPLAITWQTPTTIEALRVNASLSDSALDGAKVTIETIGSYYADSARVHEILVDVVSVAKPVTAPSAPSGTVTTTNRPTVEWANTLDADGGAQSYHQVRIFTSAQYGAGGFNPSSSTATAESDPLAVAFDPEATDWTPSSPLADGTYRAYVRVAQTVNGALHWSDWAYTGFVLNVDEPGVPLITATPVDADGAIMVDVDHQSGAATTTHLELQRSLDAGATWEAMRLTTDTAGVVHGLDTTVFDLEAPNGTLMTYRARAGHDYGSGEIAWSAWATATATWTSTDWWLKAPEQPALSMIVVPNSVPSYQRPARQGVFQPLGSSDTVIVADQRGAARGTIKLQVDTSEEAEDLDALLDSGLTLLLQGPPEHHWPDRYVRFGDQDRGRWIDKAWVGEQIDTFPWFEVTAPTGVIGDWPAGGS